MSVVFVVTDRCVEYTTSFRPGEGRSTECYWMLWRVLHPCGAITEKIQNLFLFLFLKIGIWRVTIGATSAPHQIDFFISYFFNIFFQIFIFFIFLYLHCGGAENEVLTDLCRLKFFVMFLKLDSIKSNSRCMFGLETHSVAFKLKNKNK